MSRIPSRTLALILVLGCSSSSGPPASGTGGEPGGDTGGAPGSGGAPGTGGAKGTGGSVGTGGAMTGTGGSAPSPDAGDAPDTAPAIADASTASDDAAVGTGPMVLTSTAFKEGQSIDPMYRCRTENISPPLSWTPGPAGTKSYAMMMFHSASIHWVLWDIPATTTSLPPKIDRLPMPSVPPGSKQAKPNLDGSTWYGYTGPCPATSSHYEYIVYALKVATLPGVTPESSTGAVNTAINANKLASAQLSGTAAK
ncbi:MAG TPA: YbhB/YbcL family Raf kinase inhibitor-like protein [Polyangia bacterium]|nr:YbhB/YbcL family Raf kinase inhibitor-like protein [Polyangia bacterium]